MEENKHKKMAYKFHQARKEMSRSISAINSNTMFANRSFSVNVPSALDNSESEQIKHGNPIQPLKSVQTGIDCSFTKTTKGELAGTSSLWF